jgi:hypothetical protein
MSALCKCHCTRLGSHLEPAEWGQNLLCPQHGDTRVMDDRIEQLEGELARARDALSNWYGDGSFSANTSLGGHTDWCIDHCWPSATEPRGTDDEVLDSVFVDNHPDCICGWHADEVQS